MNLLVKDSSLEVSQDKWFRSLTEGTISIKEQLYTLKVTEAKRKLVYSDNRLVKTEPLRINNNEIV